MRRKTFQTTIERIRRKKVQRQASATHRRLLPLSCNFYYLRYISRAWHTLEKSTIKSGQTVPAGARALWTNWGQASQSEVKQRQRERENKPQTTVKRKLAALATGNNRKWRRRSSNSRREEEGRGGEAGGCNWMWIWHLAVAQGQTLVFARAIKAAQNCAN